MDMVYFLVGIVLILVGLLIQMAILWYEKELVNDSNRYGFLACIVGMLIIHAFLVSNINWWIGLTPIPLTLYWTEMLLITFIK